MFAFFLNIVIQIVISIIISELFGKPSLTNAKPAGMGEFNFPTASSSRSIPVVWGTQELTAPNMTWAGDFHAVPRKEKVKTGLFSSKSVTVGYDYYIGLQLALCLGGPYPVDKVTRLRYGKKTAWEGEALPGEVTTVSNRNLYGGEDKGGGIQGVFRLYNGSDFQSTDAYVGRLQGEWAVPHKGVAHIVWYSRGARLTEVGIEPDYQDVLDGNGDPVLNPDGTTVQELTNPIQPDRYGYVANSTNLRTFWFTVVRQPNPLNLAGGTHIIGLGANPANMIYEILTDQTFGLGMSDSLLELSDLQALAQTCYDEGLGLSMTWQSERSAEDMMQDILDHVAGVYFEDKTTGKLRFKLIRGGYDTVGLPTLDYPNVIEVKDYTKTNWEGSMNQVSLAYSEPERYFENEIVVATDLGNGYIQGKIVPRSIVYYGFTDKQVALNVAYRELKLVSLPLARVTLVTDRTTSEWQVGDLFLWSNDDYGIEQLVMRVSKIERGDLYSQTITIYCSQDIYSIDESIYTAPDTDGTGIGDLQAVALDEPRVIELPLHLCVETEDLEANEIGLLPQQPDANTTNYIPYLAETSNLTEDDIYTESDSPTFVDLLSLLNPMPEGRPYHDVAGSITVASSNLSLELTPGLQGTLLLIDDELVAFDAVYPTDTGYLFVGLYRAMYNSTLKPHAAGVQIAILNGSGYYPETYYADNAELDYKLVAEGLTSSFDFDTTTLREYTVYGEKSRPYVLTEFTIDGEYKPLISAIVDVTLSFGVSPKDALTTTVDPSDDTQVAETDYTFTLTVTSAGQDLTTDTLQVLTTNAAGDLVVPLSTLLATYESYPPFLEFWVYNTDDTSTETSTQTALALAEVDQLEMVEPAGKQADEPVGVVILFDGDLIGVRL